MDEIFLKELDALYQEYGEASDEGIRLALFACQEAKGAVSVSDQEIVAKKFGVGRGAVSLIMKFNKQLKPSDIQFDICLCSGHSCSKNGAALLLASVEETLGIKLGQVSADGKIRLLTQRCFKLCDRGPNMRINGVFYNRQTPESAKKIMQDILEQTKK